MATLVGHLAISKTAIGFLLPLFIDPKVSNQLLVQTIDERGSILKFEEFRLDIPYSYESAHSLSRAIEQPALWAFRCSDGSILFGAAAELAPSLKQLLVTGALNATPMLAYEVACFCDDVSRHPQALQRAFSFLKSCSSFTAAVWRDSVVLLPEIKREVARNFSSRSLKDLPVEQIRAVGAGQSLTIELPRKFMEMPETANLAAALPRTRTLSQIFGIARVELVSAPESSQADAERPDEIYAVGYGLSGSASRVVGHARVAVGQPIFIGASEYVLQNPKTAPPPFFLFVALGSASDQVSQALSLTNRYEANTIKIAVVLRPTGFGTTRSDKLDIAGLSPLNEKFDYVFVIGNHLTRKPRGMAPYLTAASRAEAFGKTCIRALIALASATPGAKTAEGFRRIFPTHGFGTVGRRMQLPHQLYDASPNQDAVLNMLNDRLPVETSKLIAVLGPNADMDCRDFQYLFQRAVGQAPRLLPVRLKWSSSSLHPVLLGFGATPVLLTEERFANFCISILLSFSWRVLEGDGLRTELVAERNQIRSMFNFTARKSPPMPLQDSSVLERKYPRFLVCNYSIRKPSVIAWANVGVTLIHFADLHSV